MVSRGKLDWALVDNIREIEVLLGAAARSRARPLTVLGSTSAPSAPYKVVRYNRPR